MKSILLTRVPVHHFLPQVKFLNENPVDSSGSNANVRTFLQVTVLLTFFLSRCFAIRPSDDILPFSRIKLGQLSTAMDLTYLDNENIVEDIDIERSKLNRKSISQETSFIEEPINSSTAALANLPQLHQHHSHLSASESQSHHRFEWNFTQVNLANDHLFYIRTKYSCSIPRAKLVKVLDYHASPSKQYVPRCTVVHRCDDESGCCEDVTHRCEPSKTELVDLYFHVIRSDMKNNITGGSAVGIERLTFLNHTQCECKPINYKPRTTNNHPPMRLVTQSRVGRHQSEGYQKCRHVIKCPEPFRQTFRETDQRCICDCVPTHRPMRDATIDGYKHCVEIQSGASKLDHFWARCVRVGECSEPICPLGSKYHKVEARCSSSPTGKMHRHRHEHNLHHHHHHHLFAHHTHSHRRPHWPVSYTAKSSQLGERQSFTERPLGDEQ